MMGFYVILFLTPDGTYSIKSFLDSVLEVLHIAVVGGILGAVMFWSFMFICAVLIEWARVLW